MRQTTAAGVAVCRHARMRCQQRGIPGAVLGTLLDVADRSVPVGGGREAVSLSRSAANRLQQAGQPAALLDRLVRVTAILAPSGQVVTVLHAAHRRYRRGVA